MCYVNEGAASRLNVPNEVQVKNKNANKYFVVSTKTSDKKGN